MKVEISLIVRLSALMASMAANIPATAETLQLPPWSGVWRGTVGDAPATVCFGASHGADYGAWFDENDPGLVPLFPDVTSSSPVLEGEHVLPRATTAMWTEGLPASADGRATTVRWTLAPDGDTLAGVRASANGEVAIRLTRQPVQLAEGERPCGASFTKARLGAPAIARSDEEIDGMKYVGLTLSAGPGPVVSIWGFKLPGDDAATAKINAFAALPETNDQWLSCLESADGAPNEKGMWSGGMRPELITRRWVIVNVEQSFYCGTAHPWFDEGWVVFRRLAGEDVDPWTWLNRSAARPSGYDKKVLVPGPLLRSRLASRWRQIMAGWQQPDQDCEFVGNEHEIWNVRPKREGLAFVPSLPHAVAGCSDIVIIPYAEIGPLLNKEGRLAIREIIEDLRALNP